MSDNLASIVPLPRHDHLIAIASGKGGVGKTWFAITLSQALAQLGRKILLFDGDLGLANVDIQLGLTPEQDISAAIEGGRSLHSAITDFPAGGFRILAGRSGSGNLASLPSQQVNQIRTDLTLLAPDYDRVIIDLGAGVDRPVRTLAAAAGLVLVVTTPEPTALTDAYAFIKLLRQQQPNSDMRVVVNQAQNTGDGQRTYETLHKVCTHFLQFEPPLAGIIRRDSKVADAIRAQIPLLTRHPNCDAALDVLELAKKLN